MAAPMKAMDAAEVTNTTVVCGVVQWTVLVLVNRAITGATMAVNPAMIEDVLGSFTGYLRGRGIVLSTTDGSRSTRRSGTT